MESNKSEMQTRVDEIKDTDAKAVAISIESIHEDVVATKNKNYIPEIVFKDKFLDYFENLPEDTSNDPTMQQWVAFSGGPYNEVDVIDKNGNVIYTVPGVLSKPLVDDKLAKDYRFDNIASKFELKHNRLPEEGARYLEAELSGVPKYIKADTETDAARWKQIFDRYKKTETLVPFAGAGKKQQPNDDKLEVIY